ncbi:MAG: beta-ketoacyl-[acyl-carrier-protein] synthase family protein [Pseudomonadota bacterium]|nr:beta-ketoacyl-[acyl-carrier-protein] synthase family protein [Pseudomonadota bacterium]
MHSPRRVAITGLGALAAPGNNVPSLWRAIVAGNSGIERVDTKRYSLARVHGFDPDAHFAKRELAMLDRVTQLSLVAAREALGSGAFGAHMSPTAAASGLDPVRCGCIYAAGLGHHTLDDSYQAFYGNHAERLHPFLVPRGMPSAPASQLSMAFGLQGPTFATASACASSAHALGIAFHFVRSGLLDLAVSGGAEASLVPGMLKAWEGLHVMTSDTCRPFSADRSGLVLGEGAAVLVLEAWDVALQRGVRPLAELIGFGMGADAADITKPDAAGAARAMRAALADAELDPAAVDYVNAHGTGTRLNDACESAALRDIYGERLAALPVSSSKGQIGHTLNAAGALEAVITTLALREGQLPPTVGHRQVDPDCVPDCVPNQTRAQPVQVAMSNSFAFGGLNAVLLLRAVQ